MSVGPDPNDLRRKVLIKNPLRSALDMLVRGNWAQRREAGDEIAKRIEDLEERISVLEHRTGDHRRKPEET